MIKLIAFDMDGTLLNSHGEILQENKKAILEAKKLGVKIVIATGRPFSALEKYLKELDLYSENDYTICFNGCKIINNLTNKTIYLKKLDNLDLNQAYLYSKQFKTSFFAYNKQETMLYQEYSEYVDFEHKLTNNKTEQVDFSLIKDYEIIKMTFTSNKEHMDSLTNIINNTYRTNYNTIRTHDKFIEIVNKEASKGEALKNLQKYLNITKEETMSFGDNDNDISLLQNSKYGFAMKNSSSQELKKIATSVITTNDEDGIAQTIRKYLKSSQK